ncbi:DUF59 domain-containing protein [Xylophilus rhododendri]|uniref:DUF59 domain-containing protein n=1 Tax=Xylophilus rhododendri TaxID=2697032 RepID=A0A857J1Q2_9BURK|nr:iron-sulfur cluster assembly protein [Xylophilus rhododendri]QHI97527.1 DUF59 domain-containing protein [Xylophilus rhododendri]
MDTGRLRQERIAQVRACLATVVDPELDEPVTELDFITDITLTAPGQVRIGFRLPTYWCAANFAFLMADDMRLAVSSLAWVEGVRVLLQDHMYADTINAGVARGEGFEAAFGEAAEGGLQALRRTFERKAFQRRQAALLAWLLEAGHTAQALVAMRREALAGLPLAEAGERLRARYLQRRDVAGGGALAFVDTEGGAIAAAALARHLTDTQRVDINAEFNGALCRGLLAARYPPGAGAAVPIRIVRQPAH